jgi:uncharacterized protein YukE
MTAKPPDFEPLAGSDPVPGNTDEISALGKRYTDTATEIAQEAASLQKLASQAPDGWKGQAGTVFASKASDLATRIVAAKERYADTGGALTACANPMYEAQQQAYQAVWQAKDAQQQMTANAPGPPRPPGSKPLTKDQQQAEQTRQDNFSSASGSLSTARTNFDNAVSDYSNAVNRAVNAINNAINNDGLKDSWWDRNFGWISKVFTYIAIAVIVLAVVALIIACPFSAPLLAMIGISAEAAATIGTVLGWTLFAITALQAAFDGYAAATGKESWLAFGLDVFALVTFGFGKYAEVLGKGVVEGAEGTAKVVAGNRAASEAMSARGLPGFLYSVSKFGPAESIMRLLGAGNAIDAANEASKGAVTTLETALKGAEATNLTTFLTMSSDMSEHLAKISVLTDQVPGSLRIGVSSALVHGLAASDGLLQWGSFMSGGVFTLNGILTGG